jgi:hypothetical protein
MAAVAGGPRAVVEAALAVTGYPIVSGRWPGNVTEPTLVVATRSVVPGPPQGQLTWTLGVYVLSALKTETAEDDLEAAVLNVVDALVHEPTVAFTEGTRQTVADEAFNAFGLDVEVYTAAVPTPVIPRSPKE